MTDITTDILKLKKLVNKAAERIAPVIYETPLEYSPWLSHLGNCEVYLKCECLQKTGSFKIRGAANFLLSLPEHDRAQGVVTASTGNHAAAFAYMVDRMNIKGTIYLPKQSSPAKLELLRNYKVKLELYGDDCLHAETKALAIAHKYRMAYVSPYNHIKIIAGQGTVGLEILDKLNEIDALFCPVGGGGLISGVAAIMKSRKTNIQVIGCQPESSKVMYDSIDAGRILDLPSEPTLADGTAGGIEPGAITFDYRKELIDSFQILSEDEIKSAMRIIIEKHQLLIEGSAALSVGGFIKTAKQYTGQKVVLILSGRKVAIETIRSIIDN